MKAFRLCVLMMISLILLTSCVSQSTNTNNPQTPIGNGIIADPPNIVMVGGMAVSPLGPLGVTLIPINAKANVKYIIDLYEKGKLRQRTNIIWNQPQINVRAGQTLYFRLTPDEYNAYLPASMSDTNWWKPIFSIKTHEIVVVTPSKIESIHLESANIIIRSVGLFSGYIEPGDLLITAEIVNTYPPYYPAQSSVEHFQVQLLAPDGNTILGADPVQMWGDRPECIYFNPTCASRLTPQGAYYIRVIGYSANDPSVTYQLQPSDWYGSDLTNLDRWCIRTATNMQAYDNTTISNPYIATLTGIGMVITDAAYSYFTLGIPGIAQFRPNLFTK